MGFELASVDEMTGAIFMGAGSSMSMIWFVIAAALCVIALISGNKHEHDAYKKIKK